MQIGNLTLDNNLILAPLAGITNLPFRLLAKSVRLRPGLFGDDQCQWARLSIRQN